MIDIISKREPLNGSVVREHGCFFVSPSRFCENLSDEQPKESPSDTPNVHFKLKEKMGLQ